MIERYAEISFKYIIDLSVKHSVECVVWCGKKF